MPSVLLVDFKLNEKANILEFGCGLNSSYTGYAFLHNNDEPIMYRRIFDKLGEKYKKVTIICKSPFAKQQLLETQELLKKPASFDVHCAGRYLGMGHSELVDPDKLPTSVQTDLQKLGKEDCVVVIEHDAQNCMMYAKKLANYFTSKKIVTNVANSHDSVAALAGNKVICSHFGAKKYVKTEIINFKHLDQTKIDFVCKGTEKVVIKPTNSSGGNGVIVTNKDCLPLYIELINYRKSLREDASFYRKCELKALELGIDLKKEGKAIEYWLDAYTGSNDEFFLLQEFKASKPIADYDATGRIVFIVHDDLSVGFVDGYWKLPPFKLSEKITGSMQYVSDVHPDSDVKPRAPSMAFSPEDMAKIQSTVAPIIQDIVGTALKEPLAKQIEKMEKDADKDLGTYASTVMKEQFQEILSVHDMPKLAVSSQVSPTQRHGVFASQLSHDFVAHKDDGFIFSKTM